MSIYIPKPIDTSNVTLPRDLYSLMEELSRSNHDTWSIHRMEEGWTYGPTRDDDNKHNPCLVPYEELPEIEKDYDRNTSSETLKSIYKLGFSITKRTVASVMCVGTYNVEDINQFKNISSNYNLSLFFFDNWDSAKQKLSNDLTKWNAIILDWNAPLKKGDKCTYHFLRDVIDDLNGIYHRQRNEIPWYICPNNVDEKYTDIVVDFTISRDRRQKDWGGLLFKKDEIERMLTVISDILPNTRNFRIRNIYDGVFESLESIYPIKVKYILFNILQPLHYPELFYSFIPTDYFNNLRRLIESAFIVMCDYRIIPTDICYSHVNNDSVNLRACLEFLKDRKRFCPTTLSDILETILNITNEGSHMGSEYKTLGLYYSITGFSLQLCDVITWLYHYIVINELSSISKKCMGYENLDVDVSKDANGNYYYKECILPTKPFVADAYKNHKKIHIDSIFENKGKTKRHYLMRANVKRIL